MRVIEKKVGKSVSPEMLDMAKNLRNLATLVEGGTCVAVAIAWLQTSDDGHTAHNTFCADNGRYTLMGAVSVLQNKLSWQIGKDGE